MDTPDQPSHIGKYQVIRELGRGATSRVYLGRDPYGGRQVAIKLFFPDNPQDERLMKRYEYLFLNEAALAGRLNHPHIAAIYDAGTEEGAHYIVMEYVAGGNLQTFCTPDNLLQVEQVTEIVWKCTKALAFAHTQGVIHRDIKPANILLGEDGDIKITDFGLAMQERQEQTAILGIGTPAYMSPEQVREYPLTHQTDIYSLGMVMYRLLTGAMPFTAQTSAALVEQILNGEVIPANERRPELPDEVNRIVMRAIARDMNERYEDWHEFANDLARAQRSLEITREWLTDTEKFNRIRSLSFFRDLGDVQIWEVLRFSLWHTMAAGTTIIQEGEYGDSFFVLTEGEAQVSREGRLLNVLHAGDVFGEMLYFETPLARRAITITTLSRAVMVEIKAQALNRASSECQVMFNKAFMRILIDRLSVAHARLAALSGGSR